MKTKGLLFGAIVGMLTTAILATIYLAWILYPLNIGWFQLTDQIGLDGSTIADNFHVLMRYLTFPWITHLNMPDLPSSTGALHHFSQVKLLFHLVQVLWLISLPVMISYIKQVLLAGFSALHRRIWISIAVLPIVIGGVVLLVGFDQFFVLFHQILFVGDQTWLFNPATDPVILILPEGFFAQCFAIFFLVYQAIAWSFAFWPNSNGRKNNGSEQHSQFNS